MNRYVAWDGVTGTWGVWQDAYDTFPNGVTVIVDKSGFEIVGLTLVEAKTVLEAEEKHEN